MRKASFVGTNGLALQDQEVSLIGGYGLVEGFKLEGERLPAGETWRRLFEVREQGIPQIYSGSNTDRALLIQQQVNARRRRRMAID